MDQDRDVSAIHLHEVGVSYTIEGVWVKKPYLVCERITIHYENSVARQMGFAYTKDGVTYAVAHNGGYTVVKIAE